MLGICLAVDSARGASDLPPAASIKVDFAHDIQPILEKHCFDCHSAKKQKSGLRLDDKDSVLRGGDSGKPALVAGKSRDSQLILRVAGLVAQDEIMPPKGERLTPTQIGLLEAWIDQGASFPANSTGPKKHWAYVKPKRPEPPKVKNSRWVRNPIDNFILARLQKENLKPSAEADRATLIRRLSLDLTGLPPDIEEVDAFVADKSKDAYEKLVERLLATPHYGEKWARHWLDLARYADTTGYERDPARSMWLYRDWVINAFNRDVPFDQFTIEQLAGDMLPNPTIEQQIASGFHRNTMLNTEGGVDKEQARVETIVDRVNTTSTVWLGSTLACAQCHTHKYDPFTLKEYYQLFAFFNNADEPDLSVPTSRQTSRLKEIQTETTRLDAEFKKETPELAAVQIVWEKRQLAEAIPWATLDPTSFTSAGGAKFTKLEDKSLLASGINPSNDTYTVTAGTVLRNITGLRLEIIPDASLPDQSSGRRSNGSFVLNRFEVAAAPRDNSQAAQSITLKTAIADYTSEGRKLTTLLDGKADAGWPTSADHADFKTEHAAYFECEKPINFTNGTLLTITLRHASKWPEANIGRFRLAITTNVNPTAASKLPVAVLNALTVAPDQRNEKQKAEVLSRFRVDAPELKVIRQQLADLRKEETELKKQIPTTLVMKEREAPRETHIFMRGNFLNVGDRVYANVPAALPSLPANQPTNRLTLAHWLISPENPLTARVTVNRIWEQYFGHGIVETVEDFGSQGEAPTHPELLDWLATEFIRQGWSMKAMHRLIVTSAAYRQVSKASPELLERDPYNRLLARGPRFRVPAEGVRDITLKASGLLSSKIGGPSVFPYQPDGIWTQIYSGDKWETSKGEDKYRRGLYTFWRRTSPYPAFMSFDAPSRELICTRRPRSNTPLQALDTMNDPAYVEAAQALARRVLKEGGADNSKRAVYAFRLCISRRPQDGELKRILALYEQELTRFKNDHAAAEKMATSELGKAPEGLGVDELAAWTVVANVLLNLDETITKG
ncbi:PSD1 and planctomycete cytochrome C domain-containing protein [Pedosphaera parvula]|nr:PSD1 and planctomycete cytochrome C domain-containing protein [Pedosphaera parvula]